MSAENKNIKPSDLAYIDALTLHEVPKDADKIIEFVQQSVRNNIAKGYKAALDHTNHPELLEAAKKVIAAETEIGRKFFIDQLKAIVAKSETSKLA